MPTAVEVFERTRRSVGNLVVRRGQERLSSGSGFIAGGHLITCAHVIDSIPADCAVEVVFQHGGGGAPAYWNYGPGVIRDRISGYSGEQSYDYAIVRPPDEALLPDNLTLANETPAVGTPVCALGYPFEHEDLTLHQGIVSAAFASGVANVLKLDISINPSNSGGPVVNMDSGEVVAVVTRKATGLTQAFDQLIVSFDQNIAALEAAQRGGAIRMFGVNPIQMFQVSQAQMRAAALELRRSANVGIGYSVVVDTLREEAALGL